MDKRSLRQRHQRGAVHKMQDLTPDSADKAKLARRLGAKIGLDLSLLSPEDKAAVLRVMTLMHDDNALAASHSASLGLERPPEAETYRRPLPCPSCGSQVVMNGNDAVPYTDRLGICNEYASEVRRRAFQMMGANPLLKADIAWSRAMDLELYKLAGQALDERIDPW